MAIHGLEDDVQSLPDELESFEPELVEQFVQNFLQHVGSVQVGGGRHENLLFVRVSSDLKR